jgi:uncharacterized integral membrane protein (TIGR00698 family)
MTQVLFAAVALATLHPWFSSGTALLAGLAIALSFGNPALSFTKKWTPILLQLSVVGLGAGMDLAVVGRVGFHGIGYTVAGISLTLLIGGLIGYALRVKHNTSLLVSVGTAICGGSAIAAVGPVIEAKAAEMAVALATVFFLNAAALFIFPRLGHFAGLDESAFGLWSALAIHDTSSVVGAALQYGKHALEIATTVKLARALWIMPLALGIAWIRARRSEEEKAAKVKKPWFILGFIGASALVTWVPALQTSGALVAAGARRSLVLTLFLIGSNLTRATLRDVGARPFLQGLLLWILVGSGTLAAILGNWIRI